MKKLMDKIVKEFGEYIELHIDTEGQCYVMTTHRGLCEPSLLESFDSLIELKNKVSFNKKL